MLLLETFQWVGFQAPADPNKDLFATRFNQQLYVSPLKDLDVDTLTISCEGARSLSISTSHTHPKSATVVSTVPLPPPTHHSKMAEWSVVSRSTTSGRSQPATATRLSPSSSSSIVQAVPSTSEIVPAAHVDTTFKQLQTRFLHSFFPGHLTYSVNVYHFMV